MVFCCLIESIEAVTCDCNPDNDTPDDDWIRAFEMRRGSFMEKSNQDVKKVDYACRCPDN